MILIAVFLTDLSRPLNIYRDEHLKTFFVTLEQFIDTLFARRCVGDVSHLKHVAVCLVETQQCLKKVAFAKFCPISILFTVEKVEVTECQL